MSAHPQPAASSTQILCPQLTCRKVLSVPADARGKLVRCQHCQNVLRVPGTPAAQKPGKEAA